MVPYQNCVIIASVIYFFAVKIFCSLIVWSRNMYKKQPTLTSIPEKNENEEENLSTKWVPKKKHEVLKAKYKCLKKLFQIYDASIIGILPETPVTGGYLEEHIQTKKRRKKRSHRTKTDASAGTNEATSDLTQQSTGEDTEKESVATAVIRDLNLKSCTSTQLDSDLLKDDIAPEIVNKNVTTQVFRGCENSVAQQVCQTKESQHVPFLSLFEERPKPTRFQSFISRIFGVRRERPHKIFAVPDINVYAASDNSIPRNYSYNYSEKRRRRGLRFRRLKRPKKFQSESAIKNPLILNYVQSVQRNCLTDTTPRQCPIVGCQMISYGIINYNDHLNICHFPDRKNICHYCHEGFENEYDKLVHENEHIGISKLSSISNPSSARQSATKKASITQTDPELTKCEVPEEKLKKIVSFFEKISDPEQYLSEITKNRSSEMNIPQSKTETVGYVSDSSEKTTINCEKLDKKKSINKYSSGDSELTSKHTYNRPISCHICGEQFDSRRQLNLHVDLEHRMHDKFSKFHSCAGILNKRSSNHMDMVSEDGKINVQSIDRSQTAIRITNTSSTLSQGSYTEFSRRKSDESLSCDPSTNIVYYTSVESVKRPSMVNSIVQRVRSGLHSYKWEPGTKIIRV